MHTRMSKEYDSSEYILGHVLSTSSGIKVPKTDWMNHEIKRNTCQTAEMKKTLNTPGGQVIPK